MTSSADLRRARNAALRKADEAESEMERYIHLYEALTAQFKLVYGTKGEAAVTALRDVA